MFGYTSDGPGNWSTNLDLGLFL